ncbi:MAG: WD40/YVTN/BNR-like repeat-containing protein, partial [Flavobacteriales bacterium]
MRYLFVFAIFLSVNQFVYSQKKNTAATTAPASPITTEAFSALQFRSIGPAVTSGRIADFAVNPNNHSEYYVAAASGGVWKTTNHGVTYSPIFDGEGSYSIGCVTIDPSNDQTVWVGSGENNNQRSVAYGDGVYKSMDGGMSWANMGLKESEHIAEVLVHPTNSNIIYVAAYGPVWKEGGDRGVYKSTDGGANWTNVKKVSDYTGCNDILMDPQNPEVLYAAFHQRMRKVHTYIGGGPESAVFKSTDGGATWKKLEGGLPGGDIGRIGIALSPVKPNIIFAVVEAKEGKGGIYKSINAGVSWEKQSGTFTSGNYYQEIACYPKNPDRIFITDTYYKVSDDGGKTVRNLGEINKHIDNHAIWVDPTNTDHILVGCDGGVYESWDFAGSYDFKGNLPVTQFYKVSTDNAYPFYHVHGGTQDNLSLGGPSRTTKVNGIFNSDWYVTSQGDGFETQVDPTNPDIIYAQSQYGGLVRFDRQSGEQLPIKPIEPAGGEAYRWNWDAPLLISQHSPTRLYFGANKLMRTDDRGNSWQVISPDLTRQIDRNKFEIMGRVWSVDAVAKNGSTDIYCQLTSVAESKFDQNVIWVGTDDGLIQLTKDGGKTWTKIDNISGAPAQSYVHQIIASLHDVNTAYVCFNHHRYGDFKPYVFKTSDGGKTWKAIHSNLPARGSVYSIAEDHVDPTLLFVGTEFGIHCSKNGGDSWFQLKNGLPTVAVRDIEIQRRENDLVLATFGRGFYIMDDYSLLRNVKKEDFDKEAVIFPVKEALMFVESYPIGLRANGHFGSQFYRTPNPAVGANIYYYYKEDLKTIKEKRKEVEKAKYEKKEKVYYPSLDSLRIEDNQPSPYLLFTIYDTKGNIIRHIKAPAKKGISKLVWDFRVANQAPVEGRYTPGEDELFGGSELGYRVAPGEYFISMSRYSDGVLTEVSPKTSFKIKQLDNSAIAKDPTGNAEFLSKVADLKKALSASNDIAGKISHRLDLVEQAIEDMPAPAKDILEKSYQLKKQLHELEIKMYGDGSRASREFETAPSINDRVGGAQYSLWESSAPVPQFYKDSFNIAADEFTSALSELHKLDDAVRALETQL